MKNKKLKRKTKTKVKSKAKPRGKIKSLGKAKVKALPLGMHPTHEISKSQIPKEKKSNTYSRMETGQPDADNVPDLRNPQGVQGGRGPLNQEGEGERQNDQLAELEQIEPEE